MTSGPGQGTSGIVYGLAGGAEDFVLMWAEALVRQLGRVDAAWERYRLVGRSFEHDEEMDGGASGADLTKASRQLWSEQHTLIWTAHQLHRWVTRLATEVEAELESKPPAALVDLRNALERLDVAQIEDGVGAAVAGEKPPKGSDPYRSLRKLEGGRLRLATADDGSLFGPIGLDELRGLADAAVQALDALDARRQAESDEGEDWYWTYIAPSEGPE
jgi:hypothetical protein